VPRQLGGAVPSSAARILEDISAALYSAVKPPRTSAISAAESLDFNLAIISVAEEQFLVGREDPEERVEVPAPFLVALAAHDDALDGLGTVMAVGVDQRVAKFTSDGGNGALSPHLGRLSGDSIGKVPQNPLVLGIIARPSPRAL
jgi:hypothetical protein